jgi:CRP/FNR family cyclic AMP-dependent transcriptional regulator
MPIKSADARALAGTSLFRGVPDGQLDTLSRDVRYKTFPPAAQVLSADQPGDVVFIILEGTVRIELDQADGTQVIVAVLGPGETVGEMSVIDRKGRSANVVTMDEATLAWIDSTTLSDYMEAMPQLAHNLARILTCRLRLANARIMTLATHDVYGRVARQLLSLADEFGETDSRGETLIPLRLTQTDLASLVGASRVRVNQALVQYKQRGYIEMHATHRITVRNRDALAARCA